MPSFPERVVLGRSGLQVGPLGVAGGYGVGERALLQAFDRGVNYWYHGSVRRPGMTQAIRQIVHSGRRSELVLILQSYSRSAWLMEKTFLSGLRAVGTDYADVLLLGWFNRPPSRSILDTAARLREKGLCRHIAISSHKRPSFVDYSRKDLYSILHIRYNAAHTGAERDVFPHLKSGERPGTVAYTATRWGSLLKPRHMPPGETPLRGRDCYRFVLTNPDFNVCMSGPKNDEELEEALAALAEGPLTPDEAIRIARIGSFVHAHAKIPLF